MQYVCQLMPPAIKLTFLHAVNVTVVTPDFPPYLRFWVHIYMPVSRLVRTDGAKLYATCTGRPIDIKLIDYGVPSGVCDLTVPPDRIDMGSCTNRNDLKNTWLDFKNGIGYIYTKAVRSTVSEVVLVHSRASSELNQWTVKRFVNYGPVRLSIFQLKQCFSLPTNQPEQYS